MNPDPHSPWHSGESPERAPEGDSRSQDGGGRGAGERRQRSAVESGAVRLRQRLGV